MSHRGLLNRSAKKSDFSCKCLEWIQRQLGRLGQSERWWRRRGRRWQYNNMIIRRAAPVFCSSCRRFGGSRPGTDGRSVEVPVGKGKRRDRQGETGGDYSRGPSALAVGPGAHNMFGQEEARVCWKYRVRGKGTWRGKKGPFSLFSSIGTEHVAETRKTSRTKNALLPGSLDRFVLYARSKTGSLFRFL